MSKSTYVVACVLALILYLLFFLLPALRNGMLAIFALLAAPIAVFTDLFDPGSWKQPSLFFVFNKIVCGLLLLFAIFMLKVDGKNALRALAFVGFLLYLTLNAFYLFSSV